MIGLDVTPICVGTSPLASMPDLYGYAVSEERAIATIDAVLDSGAINFIDTSNGYGHDGSAERRIGAALRRRGGLPPSVVLATKVDPDPSTGDFSGRRVLASFAESLSRLGLSRIQLLHLHDPERISFEDAMVQGGPVDVMRQLAEEGVVGALGVAGGPVDLLRRFVDTGYFDVVLTHNRWTLLDRSAEPLLAEATAAGLAVLNAAPYGGGILAKGPEAIPLYCYRPAPPQVLAAARAIEAACARHGVLLAAAALQDSLREPRITSTVVGWSRAERYDATLSLASHPVPDKLWDELADLVPAPEHWQR